MKQEDAKTLAELLVPGGALDSALADVLLEIESRAIMLLGYDLEDPEALARARKLQGEIKGGQQAFEALKDHIHASAEPPKLLDPA